MILDSSPYLLVIVIAFSVIISMTLHEAMHAYASYWLGDHTARMQGRLSLNPMKHIDPLMTLLVPILLALSGMPVFGAAKPVPINPYALKYGEWGMALVALAGPLTNFLLAFIGFGILAVLVNLGMVPLVGELLWVFIYVNLGFFIFNMIPLPPLDGSRVLYAVAPESVQKWMESIEQYGIVIVFAIVLLFGDSFSAFMISALDAIISFFNTIFIIY